MQGVLPTSCVFCVLVTVFWLLLKATREIRVSAFGEEGTQHKRTPLHLNFVQFWYWEWVKNIFILKNATV